MSAVSAITNYMSAVSAITNYMSAVSAITNYSAITTCQLCRSGCCEYTVWMYNCITFCIKTQLSNPTFNTARVSQWSNQIV